MRTLLCDFPADSEDFFQGAVDTVLQVVSLERHRSARLMAIRYSLFGAREFDAVLARLRLFFVAVGSRKAVLPPIMPSLLVLKPFLRQE
jgi:hypothetical protein